MQKNKNSSIERVLISLPFLPITTIGVYVVTYAYGFRYAMLWAAAYAVPTILSKTIGLYDDFCHKARYLDKEEMKYEISKSKLKAEIYAAIAVVSFLTAMYKTGMDFDQYNTPIRRDHIAKAMGKFGEIVSFDCSAQVAIERIGNCSEIYQSLSKISDDLWEEQVNESEIKVEASKIEEALRLFNRNEREKKLSLEVKDLVSGSIITIDEWYKILSFTTPLILLLATTYTIPRKLSIAWFEASKSKNPVSLTHRIRVFFLSF